MGDIRGAELDITTDFVQELAASSDGGVSVSSFQVGPPRGSRRIPITGAGLFQVSPGSGRGDNYTSMLYRIRARGTTASGEPWSKSYVYKCLPRSRVRREAFKSESLFRNEVAFYTRALPALLQFQASRGRDDFGEVPEHYLAESDVLVLEDMKERGFVMADRKKGLDVAHCEAVLK